MRDLLFVRFWLTQESSKALKSLHRIISPLDNSIPNKPCRTCKNRFHAACLYKVRSPAFSLAESASISDTVVQDKSHLELSPL